MKMDTHFDPSPLFVSKPAYQSMEKIAAITLGRDANNWEQEISQALHKEHPFIQEHNINIFMTKTDPETGTAIGSLQLDSKILIPIIIDKFKLAPLDLFYNKGKLFPLTRSSLETVLQDTSLGTPEAPGQGEMSDVSLYGRAQPPFDGKYTYAASFADVTTPTVFGSALYAALGGDDLLKHELSTNETFFKVAEMYCSSDYQDKPEKKAKMKKKAGLSLRTYTSFAKVAAHGLFEISSTNGRVPALIFDSVMGLDGTMREGRGFALGLTKEAHYAYLEPGQEVAGRKTAVSGNIDIGTPMSKTAGVFFKMTKQAGICTDPIFIDHVVGQDEWVCHDSYGQRFRMQKTAEIKSPVFGGGVLSIPADWTWGDIKTKTDVMTVKEAALTEPHSKEYFSISNFGGRYTVRGLDGFAADGDDIEKTATALNDRFETRDVVSILNNMTHGDTVYVCVDPVDTEFENVYEQMGKLAGAHGVNFIKEATYVRPCGELTFKALPWGSIKLAAVTDDEAKQTVDAILGLNFLNPENLYKFADKVTLIEEAKETVAKLLLASRLGLDIDSRPLRTAMFALESVAQDLRELQNAVEVQSQSEV